MLGTTLETGCFSWFYGPARDTNLLSGGDGTLCLSGPVNRGLVV